MADIGQRTGQNFAFARAVAILLVFAGHFGTGIEFFWVAVTVGLFVFSFSSGYFTSAKYHGAWDLGAFWRNKLLRLGPALFLLNAFLLALFLLQGREGIWTWQTAAAMLGWKGFLTWFRLENPSPFGAGLWFLTLLLLFYALYPLLRRLNESRKAAYAVACVSLLAAVALQYRYPMGHALWQTAWGFVFGVCVQRTRWSVPTWLSAVMGMVLAASMAVLNLVFVVKELNVCLLFAIAACAVLWLKDAALPPRLARALKGISAITLEIYILHTYLFVHYAGSAAVHFLSSLGIVLLVAWLLARAALMLRHFTERHMSGTPG